MLAIFLSRQIIRMVSRMNSVRFPNGSLEPQLITIRSSHMSMLDKIQKLENWRGLDRAGRKEKGATGPYLVMQDNADQRTVYTYPASVVINESEFTEAVQKEADARPSCTDHLRQRLLVHPGNQWNRF